MADGFKVESRVSGYDVFSPIKDPEDAVTWSIQVVRRSEGQWAVQRGSRVLSRAGTWVHETSDDQWDDAWLAEHRFARGEALERAEAALPLVKINGLTVADVLAQEVESG